MKGFIKSALRSLGFELRRTNSPLSVPTPGTRERPIGSIRSFLEDIKARGFRPRGIIDVGANRGEWTRMAISIFPSARVILIEPQTEMEEQLGGLARSVPDCVYVKAGVGRSEGVMVQTISDDLDGSSFLPEISQEELQAGRQRKTNITTIDGVLAGVQGEFHPDLVKLDIQGFELEALAGAKSTFGVTEVYILETSLFQFMPNMPVTRDVITFMSDHGYEIYDITEILRRPHDGALGQVDFSFVKRDGMFRRSAAW